MWADAAIQSEAARQLVYKAAATLDEAVSGRELAPIAAMWKCFTTETAMNVATDPNSFLGGRLLEPAEYRWVPCGQDHRQDSLSY